MAYTQTQWKSGDVITSEKLNKIENGIANNCIVIIPSHMDEYNNHILEIKAGDLYDICNSGKIICYSYAIEEDYTDIEEELVSHSISNYIRFITEWWYHTFKDGSEEYAFDKTFRAYSADDFPVGGTK